MKLCLLIKEEDEIWTGKKNSYDCNLDKCRLKISKRVQFDNERR